MSPGLDGLFVLVLFSLEVTEKQYNKKKRSGKLSLAFKCKLFISGIPGKCIVRALIKSRSNNDIPLGLGAWVSQPLDIIRQLWKHVPLGSRSSA